MFSYYIKEIKNRSCFVFFTWVTTIIISYIYKEHLLFLCLKPGIQFFNKYSFYFIFTDLTEIFSTYIKLTYFITNQMTLFIFIYHLLMFITPGLYKFEYEKIKNIVLLSFSFWIIFVLLLNNMLLPLCWDFFLGFQESTKGSINFFFEAKFNEYLNFYLKFYKLCLMCICIFISIFICLDFFKINKLNLYNKIRKKFYFSFLILSTLITPPDVISQILFSSVFILLFEFIIVLNLFQKNLVR